MTTSGSEQMDVVRVNIHGDTASFRRPFSHVSQQLSFTVPPPSTVLGILSAAAGHILSMGEVHFGYMFSYEGKGFDLEKIYEYGNATKKIPTRMTKSNIIKRQFLYGCDLTIYVKESAFKEYFTRPRYTLLLGRQKDLAYVTEIDTISAEIKETNIQNTVIPFQGNEEIPGEIVTLPTEFTQENSRKPKNIKQWLFVTTKQKIEKGYYDGDYNTGFYLHGI